MEFERITPKNYPVNLIDKDWNKRKLFFESPAKSFPDMIHNMEVRDDDVWVITNHKSGTTWMQELLWLLMNDCNFEAALAKDLELRSPFLEFDFMINSNEERALKPVEELSSPRLIKSHLPLPLLPAQLWQKKAKVVYVFRNPKDAWVSLYYHGVTVGFNYGRTLEQHFDEMIEIFAEKWDPIEHAAEFYQLRNEPWVYYTSFERMKQNLGGVIDDLCRFLNKTVTAEQMERLLKHLSFDEMKSKCGINRSTTFDFQLTFFSSENPTTNHLWEFAHAKHPNAGKEVYNFIRRGKVNGYKDELKPEQIEKADRFFAMKLRENNVTLEELLLL
ncbi:hypothetical protein KR222_007714 [Zaprionus bogoriensis]|nr:hypothetical protein KR222_007714 [Zaprionus bogoriensis]